MDRRASGPRNRIFQFASIGSDRRTRSTVASDPILRSAIRTYSAVPAPVTAATANDQGVRASASHNSSWRTTMSRMTACWATTSSWPMRNFGRPRPARRLGAHGRPVGGTSILQDRAHAFIANNTAVTRDVPPVRHGGRAAGGAALRQCRRHAAPRLHGRADPQCAYAFASCISLN